MSLTRKNGYEKTDFNFATARSVIRVVYLIIMALIVISVVVSVVDLVIGRPHVGFAMLLPCVVLGLLLHVGYSFLIGFFELIKHVREVRNELVELRMKSDVQAPAPVGDAQSAAGHDELAIVCPYCGATLELPGQVAEGQHVLCTNCGRKFEWHA